VVTGEYMTANRKYRDAVQFSFSGPCCITANELPKIEDETDALYGRIAVLTFDRAFDAKDAREQLKGYDDLVSMLIGLGEMPGVLNWALAGAAMAVRNKALPVVTESKSTAEEWRSKNDPVFSFVSQYCEVDEEVYTLSQPLSYAVAQFSAVEHHEKLSPSSAMNRVARVVRTNLAGVSKLRRQHSTVSVTVYDGLRINKEGLRWLEAAREAGLVPRGADLSVNQSRL
jgi:hypothetical protein